MSDAEREDVQLEDEGNEANAQLLELQDALINAMTATGLLGKIRAELRGAALGMLRGDAAMQKASVGEPFNLAKSTPSARIALLLIQDFLHHNGLDHSSGVLEAEACTNLHSDEDAAVLQNKFVTIPGDGSILERLVSTVLEQDSFTASAEAAGAHSQRNNKIAGGNGTLDHTGPPSHAVRSTALGTVATDESLQDDVSTVTVDDAIRDGLDRYEASLLFQHVDGPLNSVDFDSVEPV